MTSWIFLWKRVVWWRWLLSRTTNIQHQGKHPVCETTDWRKLAVHHYSTSGDIDGISRDCIDPILTEHLGMYKVGCCWVPRMFGLRGAATLPHQSYKWQFGFPVQEDPLLFWARIVTEEETWLHQFKPENINRLWCRTGDILSLPAAIFSPFH